MTGPAPCASDWPTKPTCLTHDVELDSSGQCSMCLSLRQPHAGRGACLIPPLYAPCPICHAKGDEKHFLSCPNYASELLDPITESPSATLKGHPKFYKHLERLKEMHSQKAQAYEGNSGYYANYRRFGKWAAVIAKHPHLAGFCYAMLRLEEKLERVRNVLEGAIAGDEPIEQDLDDMAVISIIAEILYEESR